MIPRILVAGTQSGVGKTTLTLALAAALTRRGLRVQTFKVGPDFLDPTYLTLASGRPCYNLDGWMCGRERVEELFARATGDADLALIEGVMGLFDGASAAGLEGSSAEIAAWLQAPVLLVANAHGAARSLAALVAGFASFEPGVVIRGVIANHCGSARHRAVLTEALAAAGLPPLVGAVPRRGVPEMPSRHLGLVTADPASSFTPELFDALARGAAEHLDLDGIISMAKRAPELRLAASPWGDPEPERARLGVALDEAFHFYYRDLFDELRQRGCAIVFFSPLHDGGLPEGLDGLFIGGGYPEEFAAALSSNSGMLESIRGFARSGRPVYAECGGLIYLSRDVTAGDGSRHALLGLLPAEAALRTSRRRLGYVEVTLREDSLWGKAGDQLRGHEFHYSELLSDPAGTEGWTAAYRLRGRSRGGEALEGFQNGQLLASYVHLHQAGCPRALERFIDRCIRARERGSNTTQASRPQPSEAPEHTGEGNPIMSHKARIHELFERPQDGAAIEALSFARIDREAPAHDFDPDQWEVVRRMIHTTADFSLIDAARFSPDAIAAGAAALASGRPLFVDSNMIRAGLSLARLRAACAAYRRGSIHCHIADADVAREARLAGLPRSIFAMRKARPVLGGGIVVVGNAPAALLELNRLILEEGVRPALVVAVPVGFVHVEESKEELLGLRVPCISLGGRRGGSAIAVSIVHALCGLAARARRLGEGAPESAPSAEEFDTIILLGHGSRVPGASRSMEQVAEALREQGRYPIVKTCHMSRLGPHFEETFADCVREGARSVVLLPYFLHDGLHIKLDIPGKMQRAVEEHPEVRLVFGKNLGFDPLLVELVVRRIEESAGLADVRTMALPEEHEYPVPEGQPEFVPMLPEEAARWKGRAREGE